MKELVEKLCSGQDLSDSELAELINDRDDETAELLRIRADEVRQRYYGKKYSSADLSRYLHTVRTTAFTAVYAEATGMPTAIALTGKRYSHAVKTAIPSASAPS